jgi:endothelin-converting enzyme/putative endopeptidase
VEWVNVTEPAFVAELDRQLAREPLEAWKAYLRWHLVRSRASSLSTPFQQAHFAFYGTKLRGAKELPPRWKRCVRTTDALLGEALGKVFVERVFPPSVKADAERLVALVQEAMARRIDALEWMSPETRRAAREKLAAMRNKIGYPARWRDYSPVVVRRDDHAGNVARATAFETRRQLAKIGRPVDRDEWGMTPPTVNAYYNPTMNDMNFPAGVLLPPLWDPRIDLAPGYGNTGGTVGHELIHGFDDEGRQFDARGNLRDWWTEADAREFEKRAACVADQYAQYTVVDDVKINPKLTLGEDLADLAGLLLAWDAWKAATAGQALEPRDGLTPEQRFFVGFAQWDCANERPENLRVQALTNPHSPGVWRINGVVPNVPEFARAFACKAGQPMVNEKPCRVW